MYITYTHKHIHLHKCTYICIPIHVCIYPRTHIHVLGWRRRPGPETPERRGMARHAQGANMSNKNTYNVYLYMYTYTQSYTLSI